MRSMSKSSALILSLLLAISSLSLIMAEQVNETPPAIQWVQQYTANYPGDYANRVIQTTDGGYAIAGIIGALKYSIPAGWLVKTDSLGNIEWNQTFSVTSSNLTYNLGSIAGLVQTKDGGYVIAGTEASFPSDDMSIAPAPLLFCSKLMSWETSYGIEPTQSSMEYLLW